MNRKGSRGGLKRTGEGGAGQVRGQVSPGEPGLVHRGAHDDARAAGGLHRAVAMGRVRTSDRGIWQHRGAGARRAIVSFTRRCNRVDWAPNRPSQAAPSQRIDRYSSHPGGSGGALHEHGGAGGGEGGLHLANLYFYGQRGCDRAGKGTQGPAEALAPTPIARADKRRSPSRGSAYWAQESPGLPCQAEAGHINFLFPPRGPHPPRTAGWLPLP